MVAAFREKYPGSTEDQVQFYAAAVRAEKEQGRSQEGAKGGEAPEPDQPMPLLILPGDVPPSRPVPSLAGELRRMALSLNLSKADRRRLEDDPGMAEGEILALLAGQS